MSSYVTVVKRMLPLLFSCIGGTSVVHIGSHSMDLLESISGEDKSSLLHLAAESGSPDAVVYLLYKNANRIARV